MRRPWPPTALALIVLVILVAGLALLSTALRAPAARSGAGPEELPPGTVVLTFPEAGAAVIAELARTAEERQRGLMGRESLADGMGMLFIFPAPTRGAFWMKNTVIPLSIAFIDERAVIVGIADMQPLDETLHYAPAPYRYALEVPQGWFGQVGVAVGHRIRLPPDLPAASP
jgi:hypothetical protein